MDLESIKNRVANVSVYDLKAGFRKAQNGENGKYRQGSPEADGAYSGHELYSHGGNGTPGVHTVTSSTFVF